MSGNANQEPTINQEAVIALDYLLQQIEFLVSSLHSGGIDEEAFLHELKVLVQSLKSRSMGADIQAVAAISHRLEDYMSEIEKPSVPQMNDIRTFLDLLKEVVDDYGRGKVEDVSSLMRSLPAKGGFNVADITITDTEVMLVMEPGLATKIVTRELLECGYRMVNVASTMDALMLIPSMRPDLVIASRVMPELDGVDLACAVRAMPSTRDIPVALLTAEALDSTTFRELPKDVPVMRKGDNFADDVARVFEKLGLL